MIRHYGPTPSPYPGDETRATEINPGMLVLMGPDLWGTVDSVTYSDPSSYRPVRIRVTYPGVRGSAGATIYLRRDDYRTTRPTTNLHP